MHFKLSKNGQISDWKIRIISGVSFMLTLILTQLLIQFRYPDTYAFFELYMISIHYPSSAIVGGYVGPKIFRAASKKKYFNGLLENFCYVLICETILLSFLFALMFLLHGGDILLALFDFALGIPVLLLLYGEWKIAQIIITIGILFLVFRYIRKRESLE